MVPLHKTKASQRNRMGTKNRKKDLFEHLVDLVLDEKMLVVEVTTIFKQERNFILN